MRSCVVLMPLAASALIAGFVKPMHINTAWRVIAWGVPSRTACTNGNNRWTTVGAISANF